MTIEESINAINAVTGLKCKFKSKGQYEIFLAYGKGRSIKWKSIAIVSGKELTAWTRQ